MSSISRNQKIAKNTLLLYFRQILIMLVNLYSVRIVLNVLGVVDYGIYNAIGGVVTFFSFLNTTMASATQRFFSFSLGRNDRESLNIVFSINLIIYVGIAFIAIILLETIGLWFVKEHLNIPSVRIAAVFWVYQLSIATFIMSILASPFMALIIAHEDMKIFAYVSILEAIIKLIFVFLLKFVLLDKIIFYALFLLLLAVIINLAYIFLSQKRYKECQFNHLYWDRKIFLEITSFTGWTMFGQVSTVARNQAITILINQFFNPVVVAARSIASTISMQVSIFSTNFNIGLYPAIIKSYSAGEHEQMFDLVFKGSKITFFLMWLFSLPLLFEMDIVLTLWLKSPPPGTIMFTRLALVESLILSLSLPLATAARAPGRMKNYELILGSLQILIFIGAFFALSIGLSPVYVYYWAILVNIIMFFFRIFIVNDLTNISIKIFLRKVIFPIAVIIVLSICPILLIVFLIPDSFFRFVLVSFLAISLSSILMYFFGITKDDRFALICFLKTKMRNTCK